MWGKFVYLGTGLIQCEFHYLIPTNTKAPLKVFQFNIYESSKSYNLSKH